jgi:dTDP-4-amino-4,6-dideoxygalactose transaminase
MEELYGECILPNTEYLADNILALPVHHGLTESNIIRIVNAMRDYNATK